jgi:serine protease Do
MTTLDVLERPKGPLRRLGLGAMAGALILWSGAAVAAPAPDGFSELAKKVTPAVVNISSVEEVEQSGGAMPELPFAFPEGSPFEKFFKQFRDRGNGEGRTRPAPRRAERLGSGFVVDKEGFVVTNNHVIDGAEEVKVRLDDDSVYPARVVGTDPLTDLALIKIDAEREFPAVSFGDSDKAEVGDWVMAVGNPFGLGGSVTAGIISARGRNIEAGPYDDFLQIDAPINRGNSGGPLFNMDGQVIGVNTAIFSPSGGNIGIGFAIPSNIAENVISQLREDGSVERGWLGVQIQPVTPAIAEAVGLDKPEGALVADVTPESPAAAAGLQQGDVITRFDGEPVEDGRALARAVGAETPGTASDLTVWRDGNPVGISVELGNRPAKVAALRRDGGDAALTSDLLGAKLAALTPKTRQRFGIEEDVQGVLVVDVAESAQMEQGLRPGDVIRRVGQTAVTSPEEVQAEAQAAQSSGSNALLLLVNRQGRNIFVGLKLGVA